MLRYDLTVSAVDEERTSPSAFSLKQNYPNPFNPSTVVSFQLPVSSFVTLKVYTILGQEVSTLVNQEMKPGSYEVTWNVPQGGMSSGLYFYKLTAGKFSQVKKMLLAK